MNKQTLGKFDQNASLKKSIVVCLLAAALLVSMVGMASADVTWDLDDDGVMYKEPHSETDSVTVTSGSSYVWRAEYPAQPAEGVCFPSGRVWGAFLEVSENLTGKCTAYFGYWDGSTFHTTGNSGTHWSYNSYWHRNDLSISSQEFTVPHGNYLALKIENTGDSSFTVTTDGDSECKWSEDTPPYPVPELPTIILMSTGLLALFGYVAYRRRNNKSQ